MSNTELDGVMRRLEKLLAIANDTRANQAEAAAAAKMAENVMRKYQIEHADALRSEFERKSADTFATADCVAIMKRDINGKGEHRNRKVPGWGSWLAFEVAKLNDCEIRFGYADRAVIRFFGYKPDVQVASWTFDYLVGCMIGDIRAWQKAYPRSKAESESYRRGFVLSLCSMLKAERRKKEAEMQAAVSSRALVVVKAQAVAEHFGTFSYGTAKRSTISEGDAYRRGMEAGSKVSMRQGVGSSTSNATLRIK